MSDALEVLLQRMGREADFPGFSATVRMVADLATNDEANLRDVARAILDDYALTHKLLRVVNSPFYRTPASAGVGTVSRAIVVLGYKAVCRIALSLALLDRLECHQRRSEALKQEYLRAYCSAVLARELAVSDTPDEREESFICALLHDFGRLLALCFFFDEAVAVKALMERDRCSEERASAAVFGLGYRAFGAGVARALGFRHTIVQSMADLPGKVSRPLTRTERLGRQSAFANAVSEIIHSAPADRLPHALDRIRRRFGAAFTLSRSELDALIDRALEECASFADAVGIEFDPVALRRTAAVVVPGEANPPPVPPVAALSEGIHRVGAALVNDVALNDLLRSILGIMHEAMGFKRVMMCIRDTRRDAMRARCGIGDDADGLIERFCFPLGAPSGVFGLALEKREDILISDANAPNIAASIPLWHRDFVKSETFVLLPMVVKGEPIALIYADKDRADSLSISTAELACLRTLRDQAITAIKQSVEPRR